MTSWLSHTWLEINCLFSVFFVMCYCWILFTDHWILLTDQLTDHRIHQWWCVGSTPIRSCRWRETCHLRQKRCQANTSTAIWPGSTSGWWVLYTNTTIWPGSTSDWWVLYTNTTIWPGSTSDWWVLYTSTTIWPGSTSGWWVLYMYVLD